MKKILYALIGIIILIFIVSAIFVIRNKPVHVDAVSDYKTITAIPGVSFQINTNIVDKATAISQISEGIDITSNQFYTYKDGQEKYILFSLDNIVVAVQKGTNFHFDERETAADALAEASVMGIWLDSDSKKFKPSTKGGVTVANVNAGVVITNELYADFVGQLATISDGNTEYSIFAGIPGEGKFEKLSDAAQENLHAIVTSIQISNNTSEKTEEAYAVTIGTNEVEQVEVQKEDVKKPESTVDDTITVTEDSNTLGDITVTASPTMSPEPKEERPEPIQATNQKKIVDKREDKAYSSDIYTLLDIGDNGIIVEYDLKNQKEEQPIIEVKKLYTGAEAINIIKRYCSSGQSGYNYFDADAGSSWNVIEYDLSYKNCISNPYINIKLKGFDGNELKYRGIKYSAKTFDIMSEVSENGDWNSKYYCFFAVPNGCKEYVLECGTGCLDNPNMTMNKAAYYKIH